MIIKDVTRRFLYNSSRHGLVQIKQARSYCFNLESQSLKRVNPFRRLLIKTHEELEELPIRL